MVDLTKNEDVLMLNDLPTQNNTVFDAYEAVMYCLRASGIYHSDPGGKCLYQMFVPNCLIHIRQEGAAEHLDAPATGLQSGKGVLRDHPGFKHVVRSILLLSTDAITQDK